MKLILTAVDIPGVRRSLRNAATQVTTQNVPLSQRPHGFLTTSP